VSVDDDPAFLARLDPRAVLQPSRSGLLDGTDKLRPQPPDKLVSPPLARHADGRTGGLNLIFAHVAEHLLGRNPTQTRQGPLHRLRTAAIYVLDLHIVDDPPECLATEDGQEGRFEVHQRSTLSDQ